MERFRRWAEEGFAATNGEYVVLINTNQLLERRAALRHYPYLPLFYSLPQPLVVARKMDKFPRNPFAAISNPKWRKLYHTVGWKAEVADLWALTIWPYLGIRGGISNYSYRDPFVILAFSLPLWTALLAAVGINLDSLAMCPDNGEIAYLTEEQTDKLCIDMAKMFWHDPYTRAQPILEIVKKHRAHEDFANRKTAVRIDFHRKYYHTRTKSELVPIDDVLEEAEYVPEDNIDIDNVVANDWVNKFYGWLGNKKDIDICKLLYIGCTQKETSERLGYKNHSGVNKRIAKIRKALEAYVKWQRDIEAMPPPKPTEPSGIKYHVIKFAYQRNS